MKNATPDLTFPFLIATVIILFLVLRWRQNGKVRLRARQLLPNIREAVNRYNQLTNQTNYFSNYEYQQFLASAKPLKKQIPVTISNIGLANTELALIREFLTIIKSLPAARKKYNNEFVPKEISRYEAFFSTLEAYPLSYEQMEAVVRDEDNNLVIAGAGTGKTTTVSAKVAYLLKKKLATPQDLLIISFTKTAVEEMYDRCVKFCGDDLKDTTLEVKTFNAFGYLVNRTCSTGGLRLAFDGDEQHIIDFLGKSFRDLFLADDDFMRKATNFIAFFNRPFNSEFNFETKDQYLKHESNYPNVSLDGKKMKSGQEVQIANFFYLNSVKYEYEKMYKLELNDRNPRYGDYCPDFYLPDYGIWLEHFGIDEDGNVPSYFKSRPPHATARETYHEGMKWKEEIHAKYQTTLLKSYSYEAQQGRLIPNLRRKLEDLGVVFKERSKEDIIKGIEKSPEHPELIRLIYTFLNLMKSNNKQPSEFRRTQKKDTRLKVFLDVFSPIYQQYEARLSSDSAIDYNDMVNQATAYINQGSFPKKYKYILVDEFQDMSVGRYQLLKSLLQANTGAKLYAVGDDWQSIFRFTGTDISIMTQFSKQFGYAHQSKIAKTYRFNSEILKASSTFIQKNPAQIKKELHSDLAPIASSFEFIPISADSTKNDIGSKAKSIEIDRILAACDRDPNITGPTIFLIGRYHHNRPEDYRAMIKRYPNLSISYYTAHSAKGLTCDYAILLDVDSGQFGFPSEVADDPILNYLLHEGDDFENAEERRLFYVALTRAKHKIFFLYNEFAPSKFLMEFMEDNGVKTAGQYKVCPECSGRMVLRQGPHNLFYGCSNYPACKIILKIQNTV